MRRRRRRKRQRRQRRRRQLLFLPRPRPSLRLLPLLLSPAVAGGAQVFELAPEMQADCGPLAEFAGAFVEVFAAGRTAIEHFARRNVVDRAAKISPGVGVKISERRILLP